MFYHQLMQKAFVLFTALFFFSHSSKAQSELVINEIMAANVDMFVDPSFNFGGWIEVYNPTDQALSLRNCYISNDPENLKLHLLSPSISYVPAHGFKTIWFDHLSQYAKTQIGFKLDCDGGTIYISDIKGNLLFSQSYPEAISRVSYARTTDGGNDWSFTANPTPGSSNTKSSFAVERLEEPIISHPSSFFKNNFTATVTIPAGCTLRYTTDGSTPTLTNGSRSTTGSFNISNNTVLRVRLFKNGMLPSPVVTRSYLKHNDGYTLPVISVVAKDAFLYGDSLGIFVQGVNGRPGNGNSGKCNWNMDWDRPVNFEYFDANGNILLNQECDISACGGWSRAWTPHSFKLTAQKSYEGGINYFPYAFFEDKPFLRHKSLQIRNGGNDNNCRFKDPALQTIISRTSLDVDCQSYQPVLHFINGQFIGLLNMRETNNKHFAASNWGIDTDDMDQFEMSPDSGYVQKAGDKEALLQWYKLAENADNEDNYAEICKLVDMDEYINYMAIELYLGSNDWPHNNWKGYRQRSNDGRFRFVIFDLDFAFNRTSTSFSDFAKEKTFTFNDLYDTYDANGRKITRITAEIELVTIFLNMLKNDTFRKRFIDAFCIVAGCVFEPNRCKEIVDELEQRVTAPMALEGGGGGWWSWAPSPANTANELRNQLTASRQNTMTNTLRNYSPMKLSSTTKQKATIVSTLPTARIFYNEQQLPTDRFSGYIFAPSTLRAEAPAGYRFLGWSSPETLTKGKSIFDKASSWRYYDRGSQDGTDWKSKLNSTWQQGKAPLGFGSNNSVYSTVLNYGTDSNNKRPTYYFQKVVTLDAEPTSSDSFTLDWDADDGFVIYVNGVEAGRYLMPNGTPSYSSFASTYAPDNPASGTISLSASLFHKGSNLIAVEVHNNSGSSSDIYWDASLSAVLMGGDSMDDGEFVSTDATYTLPSTGEINLVACFAPLPDTADSDLHPVKINEVSAANGIYTNEYFKHNDWIELYNSSSEEVDVAGMYISDNLNKPERFQIPEASAVDARYSTIIPPHGYLVIWADKLDSDRQIHANFKLAAEGGSIVLTAADQSYADTLTYMPHTSQESVGLYPDATTAHYVFSHPTPGAANLYTSLATDYNESAYYTGIHDIANDAPHAVADDPYYYTLDGMRHTTPVPGINIHRGKKILVK